MKKFNKKDINGLLILIAIFLVLVFLLVKDGFLYGSRTDWESQHSVIPDYFRQLFYKTGNIFPDLAANIGAAQNIYNFAYYGFLSPIILISYLLPVVKMVNYIMSVSILIVIVSTILFYKWLKNNEYDSKICFICSALFMFATSLTFHSHRHVMFMWYMPFLILGLIGVDNYFKKNKKVLLIVSVFLIIMTSFYYSVGGIAALVIYGIYKYLIITKNVSVKSFIKNGLKFAFPIVIGALLSGILVLPVFYVILNGRGDTANIILLKDLLLPSINFEYILYEPYGIGLTAISLIGVIYLFFKKNKSSIFMGTILSLIIIFPVCNYILNGTMYIDAKCLIPLLPIYVLGVAILLKDLFNKKVNFNKLIIAVSIITILAYFNNSSLYKYFVLDIIITLIIICLYIKFKKEFILFALLIINIPLCYGINMGDNLVQEDTLTNDNYRDTLKLVDSYTNNDNSFYRSTNLLSNLQNVNRIYNMNYYNTTLYSSIYNMNYNKYYFDDMNNNIPYRNRSITPAETNIFNNYHMGIKFILSDKKSVAGYSKVDNSGDINLFKSDNELSIGYLKSKSISNEEFNNLEFPYKSEALLKYAVAEQSNSSFESNFKPIELDESSLVVNSLSINKTANYYLIDAQKDSSLEIKLDNYHGGIVALELEVMESAPCSDGDTAITIGGVTNKLTCAGWKYHNKNNVFDYIIKPSNNKIKATFYKGQYKIKNIKVYEYSLEDLNDIINAFDKLIVDKNKTKGDVIYGDINVKDDGYLVITIPYDKGYSIKVDNKEVNVEQINNSFIGTYLENGTHSIEIEYKAPWKNIGIIVSGLGLLCLVGVIIKEKNSRN